MSGDINRKCVYLSSSIVVVVYNISSVNIIFGMLMFVAMSHINYIHINHINIKHRPLKIH